MRRRSTWTALAFALGVAWLIIATGPSGAPVLKAPEAQAQAPVKFMGTLSCSTSKCHGDPKGRADYPKLNESLAAQGGLHVKSFQTLTNESLKSGKSPSKIAKSLNIAQAETSDRCLVCHALNVKPERRGTRFNVADGVQCEACHGPSEKWLEGHKKPKDWTHQQSVQAGMYDTMNLLVRADQCVSCHLAIDADMVAAGHPDLFAFELDTFGQSMPSHWRDRGGAFNTRVWAIGQTVALREAMKQVAQRASGNVDDKLLTAAWLRARGHAAVLRHGLSVAAPDSQKILDQRMASLTETMAKGAGDRPKIAAGASEIAKAMEQVAPVVAKKEFGKAGAQAIMQSIAADADAIAATGVRGAQQAAMALDRLYNAYTKGSGQMPDKALSAILDKMFTQIEDATKYDAGRFAADLKEFQKGIK